MGKASRDKGARWERKVAKMLREAGIEAKRGLGQARSASEVADTVLEDHWPELKCGEPALYPLRALEQATKAAQAHYERTGKRLRPVAICKPDRKQPTATFRAEVVLGDPGLMALADTYELTVTVSLEDWIRMVAAQQRDTQGGEK